MLDLNIILYNFSILTSVQCSRIKNFLHNLCLYITTVCKPYYLISKCFQKCKFCKNRSILYYQFVIDDTKTS